jgi:excinuclease ABC subunit A
MSDKTIRIEGASQHNLKHISLDLPLNEMIVVTGVSGSGKSSLAFDTIYGEGQRRYVETFSPYARQFLDRMDKPRVDRILGIPPAIAIDQTNPVRTSRSTVGTMTELNDHLKLLFARAARLFCRGCARPVTRDTPDSVYERAVDTLAGDNADEAHQVIITFPVTIPANFSEQEIRDILEKQGYRRILDRRGDTLDVVQSRVRLEPGRRARIVDDLETALKHGHGHVAIHPFKNGEAGAPLRFSEHLHCPDCDIEYDDPTPNLFSFNSPVGACETCRGFGRVIGVDYGLVVPDERLTLAQGAIKPWQSESYSECQDELLSFARQRGIPTDVPWAELSDEEKHWVIQGEGRWEDGLWYGVKRFFDWLETKAYRMHIRVLLSRYRAYKLCPACDGARLKPEALLWRIGPAPGLSIHAVMLLPIADCLSTFESLSLPSPVDEAADLLLTEIRTRLRYLVDVGLGYLTLDRQSRTLSGGEVQRINLTTALGTSLVNTLFVLDEPSIGLHSRDIQRLIRVLHRLRDAGNTLLIVEHDPEVIRAADRVLDLGPGPGERGGEIVFFGDIDSLERAEGSLTADYLVGRRRVAPERLAGQTHTDTPFLTVHGAAEHNLKDIDVTFPLNRLVCVTGVSGSGKSTLVEDICFHGLNKRMHRPTETPGKHRDISGYEALDDVVLVDQSAIGKTTRSNPASYVGAFDEIRKLFAKDPLAKERGYTAGTFSFNSKKGQCPECSGNGFQRVEMQFLSDVYLRCPECDGKRYREDVLDVRLRARASIADVLDMTVTEAQEFFAEDPAVLRGLEPLASVGLGYMKLGQPVPTLSGGEAQRLKLAGHLVESGKPGREHMLFLFDEPTTGLHFHDIAVLLRALRRLLDEGHSVIVIEHNLDVIAAADWIVDLGPEGGQQGGRVVCSGTPEDVTACDSSHTGAALRTYLRQTEQSATEIQPDRERAAFLPAAEAPAAYSPAPHRANGAIQIHHAREHNLKNVDVRIPRDVFTVITGISGSGKSTVAFDILFSEGQRRYLESLNAYARQFVQPTARPDVDAVLGVPPTVAIEQRTSRGGRKSTVATVTEVYHFMRLLFVKLGTQYCPDCDVPIQPQTEDAIVARLLRDYRGQTVQLLAPLIVARKGYYTDLAKWAARKGFEYLRVDGELLPTGEWPRLDRYQEHTIQLPVADVDVHPDRQQPLKDQVHETLEYGHGVLHVAVRDESDHVVLSTLRACPSCNRSFAELDPRLFSYNSKHGWCPRCYGTGLLLKGFDQEQTGEERLWNEWWDGAERVCPACDGRRLRPEALAVRFRNRTIADFAVLSVDAAAQAFSNLELDGREVEIARDILTEIRSRLGFLHDVGLSYLSLDRAAPTLSGGEAQRIRLAAQLGSNLRGVCYILDEPTIGLHARDNRMLLDTLKDLKDKGNTVVVVEHDEDTIRRAEHLVDLGPGAGLHGGNVVADGTLNDLMDAPGSITGQFLKKPLLHPKFKRRTPLKKNGRLRRGAANVQIGGATLHNLRRIDVRVPLQRLVCVTGVSGSGKSTLVRDILHDNLKHLLAKKRRKSRKRGKGTDELRGCRDMKGFDSVARVLEVDQTPIGKTPRSCAATYVGFWTRIRQLFAATPEARLRGYDPGRFSFNVKGGRCEACDGQGVRKIEMSFLPDVTVPCEACNGARFNAETLNVRYNDMTIADVLDLSVEQAVDAFKAQNAIRRPLELLRDVGLGYIKLGQQSPTLSGGEAQRIKLVSELAKVKTDPGNDGSAKTNSTLYVLDEPTIGLHMADVEKLLNVLHRLVQAGHTVVVIEHNLDVVAEADWIVDLGPEGGDGGGQVVAEGTPEQLTADPGQSHTARMLAEFLSDRTAPQRD